MSASAPIILIMNAFALFTIHLTVLSGSDSGHRDGHRGQVQAVHPGAGGLHQRELLSHPCLQQASGCI